MLKPSPRHLLRAASRLHAKPPPTHFTSTGPHAYAPTSSDHRPARQLDSSSSSSSSPLPKQSAPHATTVQLPGAVPARETPRQRVERLRAAARQARFADLPWQDRMIDRGRILFDYAQRGFTIFLIGLTGVLAVVTVYSVYDMISYNRRRTKEYTQQRQERNQAALLAAFKAVEDGSANIKQRVLLKRYEMVREAEDERMRNRGAVARAMEWVAPGVAGRQTEARLVMKLDDEIIKSIESGELPKFLDEVEAKHRELVPQAQTTLAVSDSRSLGLLDRQAEQMAVTAQSWLRLR